MDFDYPQFVSNSGSEFDLLALIISEPTVFKSALTYQQLVWKNQIKYKEMPPMLARKEYRVQVENLVETIGGTLNAGISSNFIVSILIGGSLQKMWEMLRAQQMLNFIYLANIQVPALPSEYFSVSFEIQKMDILHGEDILAYFFSPKETPPFSARFEMFGISDQNFMMNTGSFSVIIACILIYYLLREIVSRCMVRCRTKKWARDIGVATHTDYVCSTTLNAIIKLFIESYLENLLALSMGLMAFRLYPINEFLETGDDRIGTYLIVIFVLLVIIVPLRGLYSIIANFNTLSRSSTQRKIGVYYQDLKVVRLRQALFHIVIMIKRLLVVIILVLLQDLPFFQINILIFLTLFHLMYVLDCNPLEKNEDNYTEVINEITILLS